MCRRRKESVHKIVLLVDHCYRTEADAARIFEGSWGFPMRVGPAMAKTVLAMVLVAMLATACGGGSDSPTETAAAPLSIVVLGDSIASGEGINYGYTYYTGHPNEWTGGTDDPVWQGDYQLCHDSAQA